MTRVMVVIPKMVVLIVRVFVARRAHVRLNSAALHSLDVVQNGEAPIANCVMSPTGMCGSGD